MLRAKTIPDIYNFFPSFAFELLKHWAWIWCSSITFYEKLIEFFARGCFDSPSATFISQTLRVPEETNETIEKNRFRDFNVSNMHSYFCPVCASHEKFDFKARRLRVTTILA